MIKNCDVCLLQIENVIKISDPCVRIDIYVIKNSDVCIFVTENVIKITVCYIYIICDKEQWCMCVTERECDKDHCVLNIYKM